ncbi:hypothetical protein FVE85_5224 [Porphyridium purpureum]|uniref:Pre-rRNA-processing protein TSR2-like n=1 Tax=Porphyridium purpureum TaxID=35688 RepID=A0A5J4Z174_PORPP|nr:hypothetical protein FVE85_5224 [Porphyridium purpureum]|eukprot:POR0587..scf295_1
MDAYALEAHRQLKRGLSALFARWTALQIALQERFAGSQTESIVQDMIETTYQLSSGSRLNQEKLVSMFYDAFDRMNCDLEDGSAEDMASAVAQLRDECHHGRFAYVDDLVAKAQRDRSAILSQNVRSVLEDNDDEDDNDTVGGQNGDSASSVPSMMETDSPTPSRPAAPEVDEDGFTLVKSKRNR